MRKRPWKTLLIAAPLLLIVALAIAVVFPIHERTLDYSGSCGRFRWCTTRYGVLKSCRLTQAETERRPPMKAFAPESACAADWHRMFTESRTPSAIFDGWGHGPEAIAIRRLLDFAWFESKAKEREGTFETDLQVSELLDENRAGYKPTSCGGHTTFVTPARYEIAFGTAPPASKEDCWLLTSDGELRHLGSKSDH